MSTAGDTFFVTGGTLRHDAPSYVERQADRDLLDGLLRGAFCYVLTSRQMGKSSLMVRTATKLREQGVQVVVLDLTAIGQNVTPEQWYDGLLVRMAGQLRLEDELEEYWEAHPRLSPVQRFFQALHDVVLRQCGGALVVFVDEIDVVRSLSFSTDEFFAAIRELYNRRTEHEETGRVTFCLLGVAAPGDLIRDTRMTPFNIGRRIELNDFTAEEAVPLARGLARGLAAGGTGDETAARAALGRVLHWTNGHPYLTQRFCQTLASRPASGPPAIDAVCEELFLSSRAREQDDNLLFVRDRLMRGQADPAGLLMLYAQVLKGSPSVPDDVANPQVGILRLSGIVRSEGGRLRVRNEIYARVFDHKWIDANMPDAELRRQRAAFYRGVLRTTAIAAVVVAALTVAVLFAVHQAAQARQALAQSYFSQAQARRVSGVAGQRQDSLAALRAARRDFRDQTALRDEAIACLALTDLTVEWTRTNFPPDTVAVALAPDLGRCALGGASGSIELVEVPGGRVESSMPGAGLPVSWMVLSPGGRYLAAAYEGVGQQRFVIWNVAARRPVFESANPPRPTAVDFSSDNAKVSFAGAGGALEVLALPEGRRLALLDQPQATGAARDPAFVRFDHAGLRLAESSLGSLRVRVWSMGGGSQEPNTNYLYNVDEGAALAWAPDGRQLAAAGKSALRLWEMQFTRRRDLAQSQSGDLRDIAFNPNGSLLASVGADRQLQVWSPATARRVSIALEAEPSGRLWFSADGRRLGLAGLRTGVRVWRVHGDEEYRVFRAPSEVNAPFTSMTFDPEGRVLIGSSDLGAFLWDTATGRALASIQLHSVRSLHAHPRNGDLFASTPQGLFHWPRRVELSRGQVQHRFGPGRTLDLPSGLEPSTLSSEGKQAIVVHGGHLHQFRIEAPFDAGLLPMRASVQALALSADGRWLATWSDNQDKVQVWSLRQTGSEARPVAVVPGGRRLAFTPDGRHLLTSAASGPLLWDTTTWKAAGGLRNCPISRDGQAPFAFGRLPAGGRTLLAAADEDGGLRLYECAGQDSGALEPRLLARLQSPDRKRLLALAFNPQGSRLAAATTEQSVQVWDIARVRRGLADLGLDVMLPDFARDSEVPLEIELDPAPIQPSAPGNWLEVEKLTFELDTLAGGDSTNRANLLVKRGTLLWARLNHPVQADVDFAEALRLEPANPDLRARIDQVRQPARQPGQPRP